MRYQLCATNCYHQYSTFITVRMEGKHNGLRIVLVYGPQEKDTEENREAFYEDLSVEIEMSPQW